MKDNGVLTTFSNTKQYGRIPFNQSHVNMNEDRQDARLPAVQWFGEYLLFFLKLFSLQRAGLLRLVKPLVFLSSWIQDFSVSKTPVTNYSKRFFVLESQSGNCCNYHVCVQQPSDYRVRLNKINIGMILPFYAQTILRLKSKQWCPHAYAKYSMHAMPAWLRECSINTSPLQRHVRRQLHLHCWQLSRDVNPDQKHPQRLQT